MAESFEELYAAARGDLYRALAVIADDRDLATEAIDIGFTRWRRKIRKSAQAPQAVGVMALAYKWAKRQAGKSQDRLSGFRLAAEADDVDASLLDRFRKLSIDDRALLVIDEVLRWPDEHVAHAIGADGVAAANRALRERLGVEGVDTARLGEALRHHAASFTEPLSRVETVKAKGTLQRIGAFTAGAALTAAVVIGATAVAGNGGSTPPDGNNPGTTIGVGAQGVGLSAANAVWQQIPAPVTGDNIMGLAHDGTNFYLLASDNQGRPVMMSSPNGLDWVAVAGPAGERNMWFQQIVATPDALVAVGQGFDDVRGQESAMVFVSTDKETWSRAELPVEENLEIGGQLIRLHTWVSTVDVSKGGFTVVGNQGADFDPAELLRDLVDPELLRNGWGTDERGMQFYDSNGQVVEVMTWDEIGLDPELVQLISGSRSVIWTSQDGLEWEVAEAMTPPGSQGIGAVASTTSMQAALAWGPRGSSVWVRSPGGEWERPELEASLSAMTSWNDKILVAGNDTATGAPGVWSSTDGATWERGDLPVGGVQQFFTSSSGIVAIGWEANAAVLGPAEIAVDDLTVLATSDGRYQVVDADGNTIVEVFEEDVVRTDVITINDPESGEVVVQFDDLTLQQAWEAVYRDSDGGGGEQPNVSIMISADGRTWTVINSEDPSFYPQILAYGNNSILLTGWSEGNGFPGFGGGGGQKLILITAE